MPNCISLETDVQTQTTDRVAELRSLLGDDVLLLSWPLGSKGTKKKWGHLTVDAMNDPAYLEKLAAGNIGVALGEVSGGLCVVDIDKDELVERFIADNPDLKNTFQTYGARGRGFWVKAIGDYPAKMVKLKTASGEDCGEFRTNGCQSIIAGRHPSGAEYRVVCRRPPVEVACGSIDFSGFKQPLKKTTAADKSKPREIENFARPLPPLLPLPPLCHSATPPLCHSATPPLCKADAVKMALPEVEHANHPALFLLARAVKTMEAQGTIHGMPQVIVVFDEWHRQAKARGILRAGQSRDQYLLEFLDAYRSVKFLLTENPVDKAWPAALSEPLPPEAALFETDETKRFVGLCYQMHRLAAGGEWFLPSRDGAKLFNVSHATICTWLGGLVALGIIVQTQKRTAEKSPRFKYIVQPAVVAKPATCPPAPATPPPVKPAEIRPAMASTTATESPEPQAVAGDEIPDELETANAL
jgi:hypothetical protein